MTDNFITDPFIKNSFITDPLITEPEIYEPVYFELIAALCNRALHCNNRVGVIHVCMLFNSNTSLCLFNVTMLTRFACVVFCYRYISLCLCIWVSL